MTSRLPIRTVVLAMFGALLALAAVACSSSDDAKVVDQTTTTTTTASSDDESTTTDGDTASSDDSTGASEDPATSGDLTLPDTVVVSSVTCSNSGLSLDGDASGDAAAEGDVDCGEGHDTESISISGASGLDDCYRAIAASSDVVIVIDEDGKFDIDDERITGHSFGGYDDAYDCQISFAEARTEPLIDR